MENVEDLPEASLAISNIFDKTGASIPMRNLNRKMLAAMNLSFDINFITLDMPSFGLEGKLIGSIGEGMIFLGMLNGTTCDGDMMIILSKCEAYEDSNVCVPKDHWQFQMESCEINTGYVRLKVIKEGTLFTPLGSTSSCCYEYDEDKNIHYLSNAIPSSIDNFGGNLNSMFIQYAQSIQLTGVLMEQVVTGPSLSQITSGEFKPGTFAVNKIDRVISIPCPKWPDVAKEWIQRERYYGWPSCEFITDHIKRGCYVVPVGCKQCERTYLDWRLSFVLVEQALVWNFNTTQLKCLLLLKQLKKFTFEEKIGDIISSYILKTVLFWVIEESPPDLWVPHQLLTAVQVCLDRLIASVKNDFCPHYFIRTCNLLAKRYNTTEKQAVLQTCHLARKNTRILLCETPPFNVVFRSKYMEEIASDTVDNSILESKAQKMYSMTLGVLNAFTSNSMRFPLSCLQSLQKVIEYCNKTVGEIRKAFQKNGLPVQEAVDITDDIELMCRRYLWTQVYQRDESKSNIQYIPMSKNRWAKTDALMENIIICHLNAAAGNFHASNDGVKPLISKLKQLSYLRLKVPLSTIFNAKNPASLVEYLFKSASFVLDENVPHMPHLPDIVFLRFEKDILPAPLQMEMIPLKQQNEHFDLSSGMRQTVAVDPLVYACFLRFWCCMKLDQNIEMLKARDDMVWCCNLSEITNKAVAFNLLGYCHQHLEEYEDAFTAFCTAWKQRPQSEASLAHIFALVYSTIRRELNETCPD